MTKSRAQSTEQQEKGSRGSSRGSSREVEGTRGPGAGRHWCSKVAWGQMSHGNRQDWGTPALPRESLTL